ncbi:MAG: CBS domain-containing protein [Sedimentisphaerales bacterium]|nr:CBS domain-containing protein [Sedimentisphaerales bacterium]
MENEQFKLIDLIEQICTEKGVNPEPMRLARDIMNTNIKTLTLDHTVNQCLQFMKGHNVRHAPVVDLPYEGETKPYFIGIVSERDVLRLNSPDSGENGKQKKDHRALGQLLLQIVTRKPKFVSPQTPVQEVIKIMACNHIDMVPVLEDNDNDLVGIITTVDLIKLFFRLDDLIHKLCPELNEDLPLSEIASQSSLKAGILYTWLHRTVQEVMTEQVISLEPQELIARAIEVMQSGEFRHIPIIDEQGKFIGLVSDRDILRNLPYAGKRPPSAPKRFREHLFAADSWTTNFLIPLENIMVRNVLHISPSCKIREVVDILYKKKISCLPVIDKDENLRGILTVTDITRELLAAYESAGEACLIPG